MKKILVIDDDADILEAIQLILEGEGFYVQTATKGRDAIEQMSTFIPDVVILDVLLSGEDGRVVCKNIKSDQKFSHIPVVMMSAHLTAKESSYEVGADSFLAKPFDITDLLQKINQF